MYGAYSSGRCSHATGSIIISISSSSAGRGRSMLIAKRSGSLPICATAMSPKRVCPVMLWMISSAATAKGLTRP